MKEFNIKPNLYYSFSLLILITILNFGCAKTMQAYKLPNGQPQSLSTRIYVFRPSIGAYAININIYENRKMVGHIGPRGYIAWETKPGVVLLEGAGGVTSDRSLDFVKIEAQPGKTYFFKLKSNISFFRLVDYSLVEISEQEAMKYLPRLKPPKVKVVS